MKQYLVLKKKKKSSVPFVQVIIMLDWEYFS